MVYLIRKLLAFVIIFLFIGTSIVSSTEKTDNELCCTTNFNGSLSGYVRNISGGSIERALVRVYFHNTYEEDYSDKDGYYQVTNIPLCKCLKIGKCSSEEYKTEWAILGIHENTVHDFILTNSVDFREHIDQTVEEFPSNYYPLDTIKEAKETLSRGNIAYAYTTQGPCYFYLDDSENVTFFDILNCPEYGCATWTNYGKMLVLDGTSALWEIDLCIRAASKIGGGGVDLYGLSYNPVNDKLYGITSSDLYEIDINTGNQTYIGSFGISHSLVCLAIDMDGVAWAYDVKFSGNAILYNIDLETGEATEYCDMGENLLYAQSGCFDWSTGILWLAGYSSGPFLAYWDWDAQEIVHVSNLPEELYALVIPDTDDICPPITTHSLDPSVPDGENGWYVNDVNVTLNATDDMSGVKTIYYKIPGEDWNSHSGDSIKILLDQDCVKDLFKFYSVDNAGNKEEINSIGIDIDQLPPNIQLCYEVKDGNPIKGWPVIVTAYVIDNCSGMDRVEFFLNDGLQSVVSGSGPTYQWSWTYFGDLEVTIRAICYDIAGNCAYYEMPFKSNQNSIQSSFHPLFFSLSERFPLLLKLLHFLK
jgi:hypothetical protein